MKILIENGTIVHATCREKANLLIENDKIVYIGADRKEADQVIDAGGCFVLPGFIDTHTHLELSHGLFGQDTEAAVLGGTTSVLEFVNQERSQTMRSGYDRWMDWAKNSTTNYGFHMSFSEWNERQEPQLDEMDHLGITSFKMYMVYDNIKMDDGEMYEALKAVKKHGGIIGVHCENDKLVECMTKDTYEAGYHGSEGHPMSRPAAAEAEAVSRWMRIAQMANAPCYVVHLSTKEGLDEIRRARARGQEVYIETCPQYLTLTEERYRDVDGTKYIMSPPLRTADDQEALWQAVISGEIDFIGTDHCSFTTAEKEAHKEDFRQVPNGAPGLQHRGQLMYTFGVMKKRITMERMVALLSANAARLFGLEDRGEIKVGNIADIVIWDGEYHGMITDTNHHHNCDNSPYAGMEVCGTARDVLVNGEPVVRNGKLVSGQHGQYLHCVAGEHYRQH